MRAHTTPEPGQVPLRVKQEATTYMSSLTQFHGISDDTLMRLAARRTGLRVPDRWVAIALILGNRIPIPVPASGQPKYVRSNEVTAPPKLTVIAGGRSGQ